MHKAALQGEITDKPESRWDNHKTLRQTHVSEKYARVAKREENEALV